MGIPLGDIARAVVQARTGYLKGQSTGEQDALQAQDAKRKQVQEEEDRKLRQQVMQEQLLERAAARAAPKAPVPGTPEYYTMREKEAEIGAKYDAIKQRTAAQTKPPAERHRTDGQRSTQMFLARAQHAAGDIDKLGQPTMFNEMKDRAGLFGNAMKTPQGQLLDRANREWASAMLRKESGATIQDHEMENFYKMYLPRFGDTPEVLAAKKAARENVERTMADAFEVEGMTMPAAAQVRPSVTQKHNLIPPG